MIACLQRAEDWDAAENSEYSLASDDESPHQNFDPNKSRRNYYRNEIGEDSFLNSELKQLNSLENN